MASGSAPHCAGARSRGHRHPNPRHTRPAEASDGFGKTPSGKVNSSTSSSCQRLCLNLRFQTKQPTVSIEVIRCVLEGLNGAPERIRTSDPLIRSQVLYPAELRVRSGGGLVAAQRQCKPSCSPKPQIGKIFQTASSPLGSDSRNSVPCALVWISLIVPPCPRSNSAEIASPRPVPPFRTDP